jgi:hypothetical protein
MAFFHIAQDLHKCHEDILEKDPEMCEDLQVTKWTPERSLPEFRTAVPGAISKGSQPTSRSSKCSDARDDRHTVSPQYLDPCLHRWFLTKSDIFVKHPDGDSHSISVPAGVLCSNYRAELQSITTAVGYLAKNKAKCGDNIVLLTDSLSALQVITGNNKCNEALTKLHSSTCINLFIKTSYCSKTTENNHALYM